MISNYWFNVLSVKYNNYLYFEFFSNFNFLVFFIYFNHWNALIPLKKNQPTEHCAIFSNLFCIFASLL